MKVIALLFCYFALFFLLFVLRFGRVARKVTIVPPVRSDSLVNNYASSSNVASEATTQARVQVQVLTHNGSLSSESE
jgi:hypothetical protein